MIPKIRWLNPKADTLVLDIAHTFQQLDNNPCPNASEVFHPNGDPCGKDRVCDGKVKEHYKFERVGESLYARKQKVDKEWQIERAKRSEERAKKMAILEGGVKEDESTAMDEKVVKKAKIETEVKDADESL